MQKKGVVSSIPALKDTSNQWVLQPEGKADLYVDTFSKKYLLSAEIANEYSPLPSTVSMPQNGLEALQEEDAESVMGKLRDDSGTGSDLLPARILKACSNAQGKSEQNVLRASLGLSSVPHAAPAHQPRAKSPQLR